jgi:hypothetical protein
MGRARSLVLMLALAAAACGGPPQWSRQGGTDAQAAADLASCRHQAQGDIARDVDIDTDIAAGRHNDWEKSSTLQTHSAADQSSDQKLSGNLVNACMQSRGYAPAGTEAEVSPHWWSFLSF